VPEAVIEMASAKSTMVMKSTVAMKTVVATRMATAVEAAAATLPAGRLNRRCADSQGGKQNSR
jgi:hypothetical protein